ncbi:hypothetical protein Cpir12675_005840 [Ceratocystis pirilliformis]|uniref:Uncharacterized protein n=1 Tax=Ceratocystis pirilliformis TaxID=259994 RepID=A0ABR3YMI4_9PEZI
MRTEATRTLVTSAKHTTTTTDPQVSPIVLSVPETSSISSPSSTAESPQTENGMGSKSPLTAGQIIGLSLGLSGAVMIGLPMIFCGRKWRYKQFETMVFRESGYLKHSLKAQEVTRLTMLEISAPLHNDLPLGTGSSSTPLAHFGATEEGYAHELYLMENAPSKAFVTCAPTVDASVPLSGNSKTPKPYIKSFNPRQSFVASRLSSFGKSARHQRLPSGDAGPSTRLSRLMTEKKLPPLPLSINITPPKRVYERINPGFIAELEAKPAKSNAPLRQQPHQIYHSPAPTLDNETSISPPTISSDHRHPPDTERLMPTPTTPHPNAMPHSPPLLVASTPSRRTNRPKEIDRESMMTEFEEDSLVSEYGRSYVMTSPESFSSLGHSSSHLASQAPTPETLTSRDFEFPFSPGRLQSNDPEIAPSQSLSFHSAVQAYNPTAKSRHVPRKTLQPYPPPVKNDEIERRLRSLAATEIAAQSRGRPPFRIVTNSHEVNRDFNGTGMGFQQYYSRDIHSRNDTLSLARRKQRDLMAQSKMPYAMHSDTFPAPLRVLSQARAEATNGQREIGRP